MAVSTTPRFGITRWSASGDPLTRAQMDASHAAIEAKGAIYLHGTAASRPSAGTEGRFYYATDTSITSYDDGVAWRDITSANTVTLTGSQTLTNKNLTAPVITGTIALPATTSIGTVSDTEISYLDGVTSSIQTQLNTKSPSASPTFTGTVTLPSTTSIGTVSSTEIGYLDGVTSAIQTQIDGKSNTGHGHAIADVSGLQTALDDKAPLSSPSLVTPSLGVATATSINKVALTAPATSATLTLANGSTLATSGAYNITLTATGATNVTLPTTGTLVNSAVTALNSLVDIDTTSSSTHTMNIATASTSSGQTKTVNLGTGSGSGSTTNVAIGATSGTTTVTLNGDVVLGTASDTATTASHYMVETGSDGKIRPKTLANVRTEIVTSSSVNAAIATSDIEITDSSKGIILKASNGARYRITVEPDGSLKSTSI